MQKSVKCVLNRVNKCVGLITNIDLQT